METFELKSPIGLQVMHHNAIGFIITKYNIPCPNCQYGVVHNWLGFAKKCPICKGTYSIGNYTTKRIIF
jgi:hypothetical protein